MNCGLREAPCSDALGAGGREFESRRPDQQNQVSVGDSLVLQEIETDPKLDACSVHAIRLNSLADEFLDGTPLYRHVVAPERGVVFSAFGVNDFSSSAYRCGSSFPNKRA